MKKLLLLLSLMALMVIGTSCQSPTQEDVIVCSFYPITYLVEKMVPSTICVYTIAKEHQEAHDCTLTVQDMAMIGRAQLVEILGLNFEDWTSSLDKSIYPIKECGRDITLINNNIHIWLDVGRYEQMAYHIYLDLCETFNDDDEMINTITLNYQSLIKELDQLDSELLEMAQRFSFINDIVTLHNAYVYMAERYHFKTISLMSGEELTVDSLKKALDYIELNKIEIVYYSPLDSTLLLNTLRSNYHLETVVLDNYEATYADYGAIMRMNMNHLGGNCE